MSEVSSARNDQLGELVAVATSARSPTADNLPSLPAEIAVSDPAVPPAPTPPDGAAVRLFLSAVHEALELPLPAWSVHQLRYLRLSERRAFAARASIGRLLADEPLSESCSQADQRRDARYPWSAMLTA
ncbi:MAG TPA: hypothetical protein VGH96_16850, partial [Streptosporangiaceae bacterium]